MPLEPDPNCKHVTAFLCGKCDFIHIATFSHPGHEMTGQVLVERDNLNALIVDLMKLRDVAVSR